MVVVLETAPSKQVSQLISADFGEGGAMKTLEQVIDAMIEVSDHKDIEEKHWLNKFFADHPDMASVDEKKRKTMADETAPATPPPEPEPKRELEADVVVECPAFDSMVDVPDTSCTIFIPDLSNGHVFLLESKMPNPIVTTHDRSGCETLLPTIHISGPLVQRSPPCLSVTILEDHS